MIVKKIIFIKKIHQNQKYTKSLTNKPLFQCQLIVQ